MAAAKRKKPGGHGGGGGHGGAWVITFADLVSLLMAFFVMLLSFSVQDEQKIASVAGSMKDAFGVQPENRRAGLIERDGLPVRNVFKNVAPTARLQDSEFGATRSESHTMQGPELSTHDIQKSETERQRRFATAATTLRQAWADMPDIAEMSRKIDMVISNDGLDIILRDQDARGMFKFGQSEPENTLVKILQAMAPVVAHMPNQIRIVGHTSANPERAPSLSTNWQLSADRAEAVRRLLASRGVPEDRFEAVVGKAAADPLFPNDPYLSGNRRVEIILLDKAPPIPASLEP